jgi:uncharacterized membrane protein YedE/YeeE
MSRDLLIFWIFIVAGAALAGWWLAVRPGGTPPHSTPRESGTPVALLILVLAVLLCVLAMAGLSDEDASMIYRTLLKA